MQRVDMWKTILSKCWVVLSLKTVETWFIFGVDLPLLWENYLKGSPIKIKQSLPHEIEMCGLQYVKNYFVGVLHLESMRVFDGERDGLVLGWETDEWVGSMVNLSPSVLLNWRWTSMVRMMKPKTEHTGDSVKRWALWKCSSEAGWRWRSLPLHGSYQLWHIRAQLGKAPVRPHRPADGGHYLPVKPPVRLPWGSL